ncbi:Acetyltransferase (GNAT) family protein [Bacillus sp. THAF10]|uniref:GNAT family N-acetyltransferase n=1 Tax=Bacillus sp. THAF10 TaxID=2587848 RepID=UPI00126979FA|nr:N-acetyltransferase [Bacillus sp. THAF10]QFT87968.1 Acetyltransferase (GNAT) family protein [Bacillus sp. THAF10]
MEISIRQERLKEYSITEEVVRRAFSHEKFSDKQEHFLVSRIRKSGEFIPELSLVAVTPNSEIVGHILLSKIKIVDVEQEIESLAMAPVSVIPEFQHQGIGSRLIHTSLHRAKELGHSSVIVLGHQDYYPKFGFKPASLWNIKAPFDIPDELFMALELQKNSLQHVQGVVQYPRAFTT